MAVDNFLIQDPLGRPFQEQSQLNRLQRIIEEALSNRARLMTQLDAKPKALRRADAFKIAPSVLIDNQASNRFTVI